MTNSSPSRRAVVSSIEGSAPAPGAGSVIMKHERILPAASGRSHSSFWRCSATCFEEVHVALVGGKAVERNRPERRVAGRLEDDRLAAVIEPEPAPIAPDMRAQEPRLAPERDELAPQLLARPVRGLPRVALERQDPVSHEALGALLQLDQIVRERKIHQHLRSVAPSSVRDRRIVRFSDALRQAIVTHYEFI